MNLTEALRPCVPGGCDHGIRLVSQTVNSFQYVRMCPDKVKSTSIHITMDKDYTAVLGAEQLEEEGVCVNTSTDVMHHKAALNQSLKEHGIRSSLLRLFIFVNRTLLNPN